MKKLLTLIVLIYIKFTTYAQNLQEAKIKYKESENNDRLNQVEAIPSLKKLDFSRFPEKIDFNFEKLNNTENVLNTTNSLQALKDIEAQLNIARNESEKAKKELAKLDSLKKTKQTMIGIDSLKKKIEEKDKLINVKNAEISRLLSIIAQSKIDIISKDSTISKNKLEFLYQSFLKRYEELNGERAKIASGLNKFSEDLMIDNLKSEGDLKITIYRDSLYFRYFRAYLNQKENLAEVKRQIDTFKNHIEEYLHEKDPKSMKNDNDFEILKLRLEAEYGGVVKSLEKQQIEYNNFGGIIKSTNEKISEMKNKNASTNEDKDLAAVVNINSLLGQRSLIPSTTVLGNRKFQFINSDWYGEVKLFTAAMTNQNLHLSNLFIPEASNLGFTINTTTLPSKDKNTGIFFSFNYLGKNLYGIDSTKNKADTTLFNMGVIHTKIGLQRILVANDILSIYANQNYILPIDNIKVFDKFYRTEKSSLHSIIRYFDVGIKALLSSSKTSAKLMIDVGFIINNSDTKSITGSVDRAIPNLKVSVYTAF